MVKAWLDEWRKSLEFEEKAIDPLDDKFALKAMKTRSKTGAIDVFKDPFDAVEAWLTEVEKQQQKQKEKEKEHA